MTISKRTEAQLSQLATILDRAGVDWETAEQIARAAGEVIAPHCEQEATQVGDMVEDLYLEYSSKEDGRES